MPIFKKKEINTDTKIYSDDYYTNRYALSIIKALFVAVIVTWLLNTFNIFIINKWLMHYSLITGVIIVTISYITTAVLGYERSSAKYVYIFYITAFITIVNVFITYHGTLAFLAPIVFALQYRSRIVTYYTYIMTCIGVVISIVVGYMVGLCDANMLLLTTDTVERQIELFSSSPLVFNENVPILILYYALPRCIIIATVIPLLNHIAKIISEKALSEAESRRRADTDGLTGLLNKNAFLEEAELAYKSGDTAPAAFVFIDMDHFKEVNDTLGHNVGDRAISDVADALKLVFRQNDIVGRFGGDEFVIYLKKMPENILRERLEELLEKLRRKYSVDGKEVNVSASIGAVFFEKQPLFAFARLMDMADEQVYVAKEGGRNRISFLKIRGTRED